MAALLPSTSIDREKRTPFLLRLFYKSGSFHSLTDFVPGASNSSLPSHVQIYTWPSCTLSELATLLTDAIPSLLPSPSIGTRVAFRLIIPDMRPGIQSEDRPGAYRAQELGSIVIGNSLADSESKLESNGTISRAHASDDEKTLQDARFVIGDYVSCAVLPPLANGAPRPPPAPLAPRGAYGAGPPRGGGFRDRDEGFRVRGGGAGGGRGDFSRDFGARQGPPNDGLPSGEWRRGERVPEAPGYARDGVGYNAGGGGGPGGRSRGGYGGGGGGGGGYSSRGRGRGRGW